MSDLLQSKELFLLLVLSSKFVWLYYSSKYTIDFFVEYSTNRMAGTQVVSRTPLLLAFLWICFIFIC